MDGENNGKPYEQMDDLGGKQPYSWKHPHIYIYPKCSMYGLFTYISPKTTQM